MRVSTPSARRGLLICLFLLCVKNEQMTNASPSPQISFGEEEPAVEEDPEVGARFGNNNKQGGLLASVLGVDPLGRPNGGQSSGNNGGQSFADILNGGGQNSGNNGGQNFGNNGGQNFGNNGGQNFGNNGGQNFGNNGGQNSGNNGAFTNGNNCCCSTTSTCPSTNGQLNNGGDEEGFGGLIPRSGPNNTVNVRTGGDEKSDLASLAANIGVRIVNNAPDDAFTRGNCPLGTRECCFASNVNLNTFGSSCAPPGQTPFVPWNQGCQERNTNFGGKTCGQRFYTPLQNLEKGQASPEEFPWVCMMLTDTDRFLGSCAIVPEKSDNDIGTGTFRVITAAHKLGSLKQNEQLKIRIIEYDGSGFVDSERNPHEDFVVSRFIVHPNFNKKRLSDDIAVIILEQPIDLVSKQGVNAGCFPACSNMFEHKFTNGTGVRCWVAGWGRDASKDLGGKFSFVQRKVDVPIFNRGRCENRMKQELSNRFRLRSGEVCAGGEAGKDSCDGDGGAPLVCQSNQGNWHVVGLVAWGVGCATPDVPGIYVNVYHYLDFITSASHRRNQG